MFLRALQAKSTYFICLIATIMLVIGGGQCFSRLDQENDIAVSQVALASLKETYQAGIQAYRKGDYHQASGFMRQVLEQQPNAVNAHYYLAVCQDLLGNNLDAVTHYQWVSTGKAEEGIKNYANKRLSVLNTRPQLVGNLGNISFAGISQAVPVVSSPQDGRVGIVPLKHTKNALMVEATLINAKTGKRVMGTFILDTGATYTSISEEMAQALGLDTNGGEKVRITTANGRIDVNKVVIDKVQMEGVEAQNVAATVIQVRPDSSFSGLLGLSFIRQFKMTIDPVANQLVFESQ